MHTRIHSYTLTHPYMHTQYFGCSCATDSVRSRILNVIVNECKEFPFFLQAEEKNKKMQELNKFVHYYTRFKNHENSYKVRTASWDCPAGTCVSNITLQINIKAQKKFVITRQYRRVPLLTSEIQEIIPNIQNEQQWKMQWKKYEEFNNYFDQCNSFQCQDVSVAGFHLQHVVQCLPNVSPCLFSLRSP